jgi:methionyl-tRNA formyltransferase
MKRLGELGADVLSRTLSGIDELVPLPQDDSMATFAPILSKSDGLIDWKSPAVEIANRVRGFQPFPSAYTFMAGKRLAIWNASPAAEQADGTPGTVVESAGDRLTIACGGGTALKIDELQIEGKRRMNARDFINGIKPEPGTVLG